MTQFIDGPNQLEDTGGRDGFHHYTAGASQVILTNFGAGSAPTGSDDFAAGYALGSMWEYSGNFYLCVGDGSWLNLTGLSGGGGGGDWLAWHGWRR